MEISEFRIVGLFGNRDVTLALADEALILVGPNGMGKSSVASIFYLTLSRQWSRLLEYSFESISVTANNKNYALKRDEISGLVEFNKLFAVGTPTRIVRWSTALVENGILERFVSSEKLNTTIRTQVAKILDVPMIEVGYVHRSLRRFLTPDDSLFAAPRSAFEDALRLAVPSRVLYLPTYRRIEKDVRDVFPNLDERNNRYANVDVTIEAGRSGKTFDELVNFGMGDVQRNITKAMEQIRSYSLSQYNNLSGGYLRDVIRGTADHYVARRINALTEAGIAEILSRVSDNTLSSEEKRLLLQRIRGIQNKRKSVTRLEDRYLAHYFSKLVDATLEIQSKERQISAFTTVCNKYLAPSKKVIYDEIASGLHIEDDTGQKIDLGYLSSGEKQIVSIFSHLYLEAGREQIVVIDEPELSLSVPWQRHFLPDIADADATGYILAVTHSPFIFENRLKGKAVDLRRLTRIRTL